MYICVGAVSRRVVEVAADLHVAQIIASRRQVDIGGGYTGYDQKSLIDTVHTRSFVTQVVRDHGGPGMGGTPAEEDDDLASMEADIDAGFDVIHIDVCKLAPEVQADALVARLNVLAEKIDVEVGGEHDAQRHNMALLRAARDHSDRVVTCVVDTGGHIWADRQIGTFRPVKEIGTLTNAIRAHGVKGKGHNQDFAGNRHEYDDVLDYCNIAPEFGKVEVEACLDMMTPKNAHDLLIACYATNAWTRWFGVDEGTWRERATCALRYCMEKPWAQERMRFDDEQENYVREAIKDAIIHG